MILTSQAVLRFGVEFTLEVRKLFHILVCKHEHASGVGLLEDILSVIQRHGLISATVTGHLKDWLHNKEGFCDARVRVEFHSLHMSTKKLTFRYRYRNRSVRHAT